ncbi:hypothetical protein SCUP515_11269 [Seiridium cupressi]
MLHISDYEEDAAATAQLIRWSKRLEIFTFGSFYNNLFYMDLAMFRAWLLIHNDSLREICIGYLSASGTGIFFGIFDQHQESWTDFGEPEERWLMQFAEAAASKPLPLKRIEVIFRPDYWLSREEDGYSWDHLDRVKEHGCLLGIEMEYSPPPLSKVAWLQDIKEEEELHNSGSYLRTETDEIMTASIN